MLIFQKPIFLLQRLHHLVFVIGLEYMFEAGSESRTGPIFFGQELVWFKLRMG